LSPPAWQRPGGPESALPAARPGFEVSMSTRNRRVILAGLAITIATAAPALGQTVCTPTDTPPATVLRDRYGVPHIFAGNIDDLSFTSGYSEAQDRLFEMEILRRRRGAQRRFLLRREEPAQESPGETRLQRPLHALRLPEPGHHPAAGEDLRRPARPLDAAVLEPPAEGPREVPLEHQRRGRRL